MKTREAYESYHDVTSYKRERAAALDLKHRELEIFNKFTNYGERPCVNMNFGIEDKHFDKLTEINQTLIPSNGNYLFSKFTNFGPHPSVKMKFGAKGLSKDGAKVLSINLQVLPVMNKVDGESKWNWLELNLKSTINLHYLPFELGILLLVLFPILTFVTEQIMIVAVTRHCIATLMNGKQDGQGDMVVYNDFKQISSYDMVSDVLGTIKHFVECVKGPMCVFGDFVSTKVVATAGGAIIVCSAYGNTSSIVRIIQVDAALTYNNLYNYSIITKHNLAINYNYLQLKYK